MKAPPKTLVALLALFAVSQAQAMRWYSPNTGRWFSRDPIEEKGFRLRHFVQIQRRATTADYSFCANSPLQRIDVNGLYTDEERQKVCDDYEREHPGSNVEDPDRVNFSGTVICKGGIAYPCVFNKDWKAFRSDVFACFMDHEKSHADDAGKQKRCDTCPTHKRLPELKKESNCRECPPFPARFPKDDAIASECKAYKALFDCLNKFTQEKPRPVGWSTGDWLIEGFLKNHPGKCTKEFPGDKVPWDF